MEKITGHIVDIPGRRLYYGEVCLQNGIITELREQEAAPPPVSAPYILPGFTDAHVHIESSMLVPSEFARLAVVHGTVSTISDPHEIANVCGMEGIRYMIENSRTVPFKCRFGAPSCVPATTFETAGATLNAEAVDQLLQQSNIYYLSEVMNFPGVLLRDQEVMLKIASAKKYGKPADGHAPGLRGEQARQYIDAGITTDHECFTREEALDKLQYGMKILIREGSAAKNFEALIDLLNNYPNQIMFCSDDKHPDSLVAGHINQLCARAVAKGIDVFHVLQAACINPVLHYHTGVGLLRQHDPADFIVVKDLVNFEVLQTYIDGKRVAEKGRSLLSPSPAQLINQFNCEAKQISDFEITADGYPATIDVIEALDGQLITNKIKAAPKISQGMIVPDVQNDLLKIVVVNRYQQAPVAKAFVKNFGLKKGAIASSVAHDSHNIIAVGADDESLCRSVNLVIKTRGGISAVSDTNEKILALPVAGLMSNENGYQVAAAYTALDKMVKEELGATLSAPFMTLSFMALLVIPHLKLSDRGLFDGDRFAFVKVV